MNKLSKITVITSLFIGLLSACSPEVGSKDWCSSLKEKPKGEWSLNEATDYTKHCLLN